MIEWIKFNKPQRYLDNEWNVIKKKAKIRICLCFPDLYEVGMSNLGFRIIYHLFNEIEGISCERAFMPYFDLLAYLEKKRIKLFSLETKTPLDKFEVLGFNLNYELNFTNFLAMLDLAGVPLFSSQRKKIIVIGGGIANPEPLAQFVDIFFLGEFEEKIYSFAEVLKKYKNKEDRLKALSEIEGFYVPSFYREENLSLKKIYKFASYPLKKVYVKDLNSSYYPLKWLTPYTSIVHDRAYVEVARGCPHHCFFCQARAIYFPYREKKIEVVLKQLEEIYKFSGYENFSFLSLSLSDYSCIEELIDIALDFFKRKKINFSLPSLRVDDIVERLHHKLIRLGKISLTLAVEAGTSHLRRKINKRIEWKKFWEAKEILKRLPLKHIKFYFMFGLPYEEEEDLVAIPHLVESIFEELRKKIHVSINAFVPNPFSYFQNKPMEKEENLLKKKKLLLNLFKNKRYLKVSFSSIKRSILEAILSRGDRKLSSVIYRAYLWGAKFDSYREFFDWERWEKAFEEEKIDYRKYLEGRDAFWWRHIIWDESLSFKGSFK